MAWRDIVAMAPAAMPWPRTLRLVAPGVLALAGGAAAGRFLLGLIVALGTYVTLYGAALPVRRRLCVYAIAGAGMLVAVAVGVLSADSFPLTLAGYVAIAVVGVCIDAWVALGPPGPYLFVIMSAAGATVLGGRIPLALVLSWMAVGVVVSIAFGIAPDWRALLSPAGAPPRLRRNAPRGAGAVRLRTFFARLATTFHWPSDAAVTLVRVVVAIVLAGLATHAIRAHHPFWATLVVVLVLSFPGTRVELTVRAVQRLLGTAAGILIFAVLAQVHAGEVVYAAGLCVLLVAIARLTAQNYLYATVFITLFALYLTAPLTPTEPAWAIARARLVDTVIAVVIALIVLRLVAPRKSTMATSASALQSDGSKR